MSKQVFIENDKIPKNWSEDAVDLINKVFIKQINKKLVIDKKTNV
jgi:hypothetical protein